MQESINIQSMLRVGTILRGIYRIDRYLSSGGFGNTYVATNIEFDERVAIKEFFMKGVTQRDANQTTVSVSNSENTDSFLAQKEKFKKEARRLRKLDNEHIVKVHDLFEENGTAYYVMDYIDGMNLAERLKQTGRPMTESELRLILPQILDALKSVHDEGMWHLDLKPANIMVDKAGNVKLIDFGSSKQLNAQKGGATTSTAITYTNGYAPLEQMGQNYDKFGPWTDIYALGATFYNLLTNEKPPLPTDIYDDTSEDKHIALPFHGGVSQEMKSMILMMLNTDRTKRPQSVDEIIIAEQTGKVTPPQPTPPPTPAPNASTDEGGGTIVDNPLPKKVVEKPKPKPVDLPNPGDDPLPPSPQPTPPSPKDGGKGGCLISPVIVLLVIIGLLIIGLVYVATLSSNNVGDSYSGSSSSPAVKKVEKRTGDKRRYTNSAKSNSDEKSVQSEQVQPEETRKCTKCGKTLSLSQFATDVPVCENCFHLLLEQKRKNK